MDKDGLGKTDRSTGTYTKDFGYISKSILIVFLFLNTNCKSSTKTNISDSEPKKINSSAALLGENYDAHFSADGSHILFVSSGRASHSQSQIYEKNLSTGRERRVTFQDGDTSSPRYANKGKAFFYASTTDEVKENPVFLQRQIQSVPIKSEAELLLPTDVYSSELNGDRIQRLTDVRGFDGDLAIHPKTDQIYFSSSRLGRLQIFNMTSSGGSARLVSLDKTKSESQPAISPDGKMMAWVQFNDDMTSSQIVVGTIKGQIITTLTSGDFLNVSPSWAPNGEDILFSSNRSGANIFEIYFVKKDASCLRRITTDQARNSRPSLSPDGTKILFTSNRSGVNQIYVQPFQPPACEVEQTG